jgi:hypothetical protein
MRILLIACLLCLSAALSAQTPVQPVVESYYKLAPGKTDEWLALFKKWHLPILQERRKEGKIVSITIYQPRLHQGLPAWDYKVVLKYADYAAMGLPDAAIISKLYPNEEELRRNERRRWEITEKHWDDLATETPQ